MGVPKNRGKCKSATISLYRGDSLSMSSVVCIEHNKLMIDDAKVAHCKTQLKDADIKSVFKLVNGLLNKTKKILPNHSSEKQLADYFASFFSEKVANIHSVLQTEQNRLNNEVDISFDETVSCHLPHLALVNDDDAVDLISKSVTKSCVLDPIPTWYVKQNLPTFVYGIKCIINMMDNNMMSKIWVGMASTYIHSLQFKIQSNLHKRGLWMTVHQNSFRRKPSKISNFTFAILPFFSSKFFK